VPVHIDEVHSEITPIGGSHAPDAERGNPAPWQQDEDWIATRRRAEVLARRTEAECFSD